MKKLTFLIMFCLLVLPFRGHNYVVNGNFEYGLNANWEHSVEFPGKADFSLDKNNYVMEGEWELRVDVQSSASSNKAVKSSVNITVGDESIYLLRFWARGKERSKMYVEVEGSDTPGVTFEMHTGKTFFHLPFKTTQKELTINFYFQDNGQTYYLNGVDVLDQNNDQKVDVLTTYKWHHNRTGYGWTAGDNDVSLKLPDGRTIWFFNDSFYGTNDVTNNPLYDTGQFVRNAVVVEEADGTLISREIVNQDGQWVYFVMPEPIYGSDGGLKNFFWVGDAIMEDGKVKVYLVDVAEVNGTTEATGKSYLGIFSYPELELLELEKQADFCYGYETFFVDDEDDRIYLYRTDEKLPGESGWDNHTIVARTDLGNLNGKNGSWEFWNGTDWTTEQSQSTRVNDMHADAFIKLGPGSYAHVSMPPLSNQIQVSFAPEPQGPWTQRQTVYEIPQDSAYWWYMPNFHGQLENGNYSISYSTNSFYALFFAFESFVDKFWYRQRYIQVDLLALSPYSRKEDCAGVEDGEAYLDECGNCVGGTTGEEPCATGTAILYSECNFAGREAGLPVGDYLSKDLTALGFAASDLSSVLIKEGYVVELFEEDNFTGNKILLTSSSDCLDAQSFNNKASSLIVRREGVTDLSGIYALQNKQSGLYMSIEGESLENKASVVQDTYKGSDTQKFEFNYIGNGYYKITNVGSGHSLHVSGFSNDPKAHIEQWNGTEISLSDLGGEITDGGNTTAANRANLIDNNKETYYAATGKNIKVQYKAPAPYVVKRYTITNTQNAQLRDPASAILYGSNDGENWTKLDEQPNFVFSSRL
ncbi:MAG: RICIN domain-containing protein [Candidatus Azobacteroides sp.]|nr:RICIN domain-containing protein [Candidatus Azobacteroides sp.]